MMTVAKKRLAFSVVVPMLFATTANAEVLLVRCVFAYDNVAACNDLRTCPARAGNVNLSVDTKTQAPIKYENLTEFIDQSFAEFMVPKLEKDRAALSDGYPYVGAGQTLTAVDPRGGGIQDFRIAYVCEAHSQ